MKEEEDSEYENMEIEETEKDERLENNVMRYGTLEVDRAKIKSNLEFLLTQNDILPLLKKINQEKKKNNENVLLTKYVKNNKVYKKNYF